MKTIITICCIIVLTLTGCGEKFPVIEDFGNEKYSMLDQDSAEVVFPEFVKGKVALVGYIFTNCPDICPLSTNNLRLIQERVRKEKIEGVEFVSISFDPDVDKPHVLKGFAGIRNLNEDNWRFLTGEKELIGSFMKRAGIIAVPGDSTKLSNGKTIYYYVHTDRISLMDQEGRIRKNYKGSEINLEEIINDIKSLTN
ncbi:MAG: SCO family protein [bacterium]